MKNVKHLGSLLLALVLCCALALLPNVAVLAEEPETAGECGEALTWKLDADGVLTVSGSGKMTDYKTGAAPWSALLASVKSIVLEEGVESVGNYAFASCNQAESLTLPASLAAIGSRAFRTCSSLKEIVIPDGVTSLGSEAFADCSGAETLTVGKGLTEIGDGAFSACAGLTELNLPENVTALGASAFSKCTGLTALEVPDTVTTLGNLVFSDCTGLTALKLGKGVAVIPIRAFSGCTALQDVVLSDGLQEIKKNAFNLDAALAHVHFAGLLTAWAEVKIDAEGNDPLFAETLLLTWEHEGDHVWDEGAVSVEPTCVDAGVMLYTCTVEGCIATKEEAIPATGEHTFGEWTETKPATAAEEGEETRVCSVCGKTETRAVARLVNAENIGDIDGDGKITASDARTALRAAVGLEELAAFEQALADADLDEKITASDARLILRAAVGLEDPADWFKAPEEPDPTEDPKPGDDPDPTPGEDPKPIDDPTPIDDPPLSEEE